MKLNQLVISFEKNKLYIDAGSEKKMVEFSYLIGKIETFDDCVIVMIDPPMKTIFNENIYGVSYDGKILWQVEKIEHVDRDSPYTGMGQEKGLLSAYNWDGFDYRIEPKTGKIIDKIFVK